MSCKLPAALRRGRSLTIPTQTTPRPAATDNYYAKVKDGYLRARCQQRPAAGVAQSHRDAMIAKEEAAAEEAAERDEGLAKG